MSGDAGEPAVTVVVVTRDRAATLRETLPRHAPYPVVVVDNGSRDDTLAVARASGAQVVALGRNAGGAGRTAGVRLAQTPYVAFADDDSWWAPGALERAAAVLDGHPRLAVLAARVLVGPHERLDPVCAEMAASPLAPVAAGPAVLGFVACGAVVRREAYLAIGGFPEPYGIGGEEEPLALDLAAAGWELAYVPAVVAHHHPSPARNPRRRTIVQQRNALWTAWRRRPLRVALGRTLRALGDDVGRLALREAFGRAAWAASTRRRISADLERAVRLLER